MENKIIFLGYMITPSEANTASGASVAGNKMQWNVINNLRDVSGFEIDCVTLTPKASFPHDKTLIQKRTEIFYENNVHNIHVGYSNLPIIKQFSQTISIYREAKKLIKNNPTATILSYNMFTQIGTPVRWLKKEFPHINAVCLLADLPIDDKVGRKGFSKFLRGLFDKNTTKNLTVCDKYIVLNKKVAELYLSGKEYIVIDGGVDADDIERSKQYPKSTPKEKNILFCGALTEYNGVTRLIEVMEHFRGTDIYCDIYGSGYLEETVRKAASNNPNIRFHGRVENATVIKKQREAWLLINPRPASDPIAQVTFPSKTFEYLLSGTPVLSTKLNGYSEEYYSIMTLCEDTTECFVEKINEIDKNYSIAQLKASEAIEFVINTRLWKQRVKTIADFII